MGDNDSPIISGKRLSSLFQKYLIEHSSRRLNYLHWNSANKFKSLQFINICGKELCRVMNSDLVYRIIDVKNDDDWNDMYNFFTQFIVDPNDPSATYVIRVDFLVAYLKSIKFNIDDIKFTREEFQTLYCHSENNPENKRRPISTIDTDIQSLYLLDQLYAKYSVVLTSDDPSWVITDIKEAYLNDPEFTFDIEKNIHLKLVDAIDSVARKCIRQYNEIDPKCTLEQIYMKNGVSTIANRFICSEISAITVRVYFQVYLRKYYKKRK